LEPPTPAFSGLGSWCIFIELGCSGVQMESKTATGLRF
jgi:hypothetical protein